MMSRAALSQVVLSGLLVILWAGSVDARVWGATFFQTGPVVATLQAVPKTSADAPCPDFFHRARLFADFDLVRIGSVYVESSALITRRKPGQTGRGAEFGKKNFSFQTQIDITGCVFGKHFQARTARLTMTGELDKGQIVNRTVDILNSDRPYFAPSLQYTANLAGPVEGFGYSLLSAPPDITADQIAGEFALTLPDEVWPVASESRSDGAVRVSNFKFRILVRSDVSTD